MLSKPITEKTRIYAVCESSGDILPGETFRGIHLAERDDRLPSALEQAKLICCGNVSDDELLFRSEDGRYYFSVCDGWGTKNGALYGLEVGIFHDFQHPTTVETIQAECGATIETYRNRVHSFNTAMLHYAKRNTLEEIRSVMKKAAK